MTEAEIDAVLDAVREIDRRTFSAAIRRRLADVEAAAGPEYEASAWELPGKPPRRMIILLTQTRNAPAAERRAAIAKAVMELIDQHGLQNLIQSGTPQ